jgi:N-acetylglutamate synthase-like GNAT family acetyltransferase
VLYEANDLKIDEKRAQGVGPNNHIFYREKILNIIRPANNKELEQVKELVHCPELANAAENFFNTHIISEYLEDGYFFVAEKEGIIVGTILGEAIKGNGLLLKVFSVKERYREQGIGTQLFKTLEKKCKETNIKWMVSYISVKNMKTTSFFRDASFQKGQLFREHIKNYP